MLKHYTYIIRSPIEANGFLIRREALLGCNVENYLFDIDVVYELILQGKRTFAKVKVGILLF